MSDTSAPGQRFPEQAGGGSSRQEEREMTSVDVASTDAHKDPYSLHGQASAVVVKIILKHGEAFVVADGRGNLPASEQETGLFWHGTRFLRSCDLFIQELPLIALSHSISDEEGVCQVDLTNPYLTLDSGEHLSQGVIHIQRVLALRGRAFSETMTITSFHQRPVTLSLAMKVVADFLDIFEVRGMTRTRRGLIEPPSMTNDEVILGYRGLDAVRRVTTIGLKPAADVVSVGGVYWNLALNPGIPFTLVVTAQLSEQPLEAEKDVTNNFNESGVHVIQTPAQTPAQAAELQGASSGRHIRIPRVVSDNVFFDRLLSRSMHDLIMMCTNTPQGLYPYGGIPWYVCPFGRDGLITSLEFLPWFPEIARGVLRFLAKRQGTKEDTFSEEEPGKILHEYRFGEMANLREIPFIPYYGSIDATPLFLIVLEQYIRWTNDLAFLRRFWPHAQAAARWMLDYGDRDGDSFLEYFKQADSGLVNQGWKDSEDAVSHADGQLAEGPIALCEAQGYAYAAYLSMSYLASRLGRVDESALWTERATLIRANFQQAFWWPEEQAYYLALDGEKRPCAVMSSNAGQCLWTGIPSDEQAEGLMNRLLRDDMHTEWGIRTLSSRAARYNPMSYHNGSVWPHDTAIIGAGFARYGRKDETARLLGNLYDASLYFEGVRLPELFCGFQRLRGFGPTRYPVACAPQSWAAGAPFLLLAAALGLEPDGERACVRLHHPSLPGWLNWMEIGGVQVGKRRGHFRFERTNSSTEVSVLEDSELDADIQLH